MKQNKYDEPEFFAKYAEMPRSTEGLDRAWEWSSLRTLLPDLRDQRVLDLGCGFGWHCRYACQQHARSVVGVDLSEMMLARAKATTGDLRIEYRQSAIEDIDYPAGEFDLVFSSLALHYVARFDLVCQRVYHCLKPTGTFVFSVEHPAFTAIAAQQWFMGSDGERLHWPVDDYLREGSRFTRWLADGVVKYHRTVATYVNTLLDSGFRITRLLEPGPPPEMLAMDPTLSDECRRPAFLLIAALKPVS